VFLDVLKRLVAQKTKCVEQVSVLMAVAAMRHARLVRYATMMGCVFLVAVMMRVALKDNFVIKRISVRLVVESTLNVLRGKHAWTTVAKRAVGLMRNAQLITSALQASA